MKRTGMTSIRDGLRHRHGFGLTRAHVAAAVGGEHRHGLACSGACVGGGAFLDAASRSHVQPDR